MTGIHQAVAGGRVLSTPGIVNITTASSTNADAYSIPMPSGVAAGRDLLIIVAINNISGGISIPTNPTGMGGVVRQTGTFNDLKLFFSSKTLSGSETGNITGDLAQSSIAYSAMAMIFENAVTASGLVGTGGTASSTNTVTPNSVSPSWGVDASTLFITAMARSSSTNAITAYPANYNLAQGDVSSGGNVRMSYAIRRARVASEATGAWTTAGNDSLLVAATAYYRGA